jgi:hypothetical protein
MSGATFYSKELDLTGSGYNETAGSQITAGGKLTVKIAGDLSVEGSEIRADSAVIDVGGNFTEPARGVSAMITMCTKRRR